MPIEIHFLHSPCSLPFRFHIWQKMQLLGHSGSTSGSFCDLYSNACKFLKCRVFFCGSNCLQIPPWVIKFLLGSLCWWHFSRLEFWLLVIKCFLLVAKSLTLALAILFFFIARTPPCIYLKTERLWRSLRQASPQSSFVILGPWWMPDFFLHGHHPRLFDLHAR